MRKAIGAVLFFGSFLIYALVVYIATNGEWTITQKVGFGTALYATSWATFGIGTLLLGPELVQRIKKMIKIKKKKQ